MTRHFLAKEKHLDYLGQAQKKLDLGLVSTWNLKLLDLGLKTIEQA
jgi:hypothetical protein